MFKFEKITSKHLLISIFVFNIFLLFSFFAYILLATGILPNYLLFIAKPIEFLSKNILFVLFIFVIEISIVLLSWIKRKKQLQSIDITNDVINLEFDLENENSSDSSIHTQNVLEEELDDLFNINEILDYSQDSTEISFSPNVQSMENSQNERNVLMEDEDFEISPGFLSYDDDLANDEVDENSLYTLYGLSDLQIKQNERNSPKSALSDRQFAFYKKIVNDEWVYERAADRERIGFDKNAIDESNVSLSDLNKLVKTGMLYKQSISYPSGSFHIFSSTNYIEQKIIYETIRRICRTNRIKTVIRRIDFPNWNEFGLTKKSWQFSFEIPEPALVGSIWCNDAIIVTENNTSILQEKKDELKALIAAATLKMKKDGLAVIITNKKDHVDLIKKYAKNAGWGGVKIFNFAVSKFKERLLKVINNHL